MGNCHCLAKQVGGGEIVNEEALAAKGLNKISKGHKAEANEETTGTRQSAVRGHQAHQEVDREKLEQYRIRVIEQLHSFRESCSQNVYLGKLPPFEYEEDELEDEFFDHRIFKPPQEIAGGGTYLGEW